MACTNEVRQSGTVPLYRRCPVGVAMLDTLHELMESKVLTPEQALLVVKKFDITIRSVMDRLTSKNYSVFSFQAEVAAYRLNSRTGVCNVVLRNVRMYKHVESATVEQWMQDRHEKRLKERRAGEKYPKYATRAEKMTFKNRYLFFIFIESLS